jgi:ACS family hexuronate transporter-like MFS transporter
MAELQSDPTSPVPGLDPRLTPWRTWGICGLMLLATMLNYMDRQTLAQQATEIREELGLSNEDYGWMESGFGVAFAVGGIVTGFITDRVSLRWLYPAILLGWSAVGFLTGWVTSYHQLLACRVLLGFFEAGQWPCALASAQRLLSSRDRPLGNSILQSGASFGAIITPIVVLMLNREGAPGGWRLPFWVIGASGLAWVVAWLAVIRPRDLEIKDAPIAEDPSDPSTWSQSGNAGTVAGETERRAFLRRLVALGIVVVTISFCWQYFRAWMPMMLEKEHGYSRKDTQLFSSAYYLSAAIGCLVVGFLVKGLAERGWSVHGARLGLFTVCVALTGLGMLAAYLPASPLLLFLLLIVGFGSLGQFPIYYAFSQELSMRQMGKVTGLLGFVSWISWALVSVPMGREIDQTGTYARVTFLAGLAPLIALAAIVLLWREPITKELPAVSTVDDR